MSVLILPQRFKQQPQYNAPIDREGLGKGMRFLLNPALGPIDLATGRAWAQNGDAKTEGVTRGKILRFDGAGDYLTYTGYLEVASNVGTFFVWCPTVGANVGLNGHALLATTSPSASYHLIDASRFLHFGGVQGGGTALPSWYNSVNRSLVMSSDGTAARTKAYLDGADSGITWGSAPGAWGAGAKNFRLGGYPAGSQWDFAGSILAVGYTTAVWGVAEARAFHDNPWQLFKAPARRLWAVSSATNYTLTADSGAFALTGTAANLEYNRLLAAAQGSFALTGTNAALLRGYALAADVSAFGITGTPAALKFNRVLQADAGSAKVAGTDVSLEYNRFLTAEPGAVQIVGTDATFIHDAPGSYTLSAESASFGIAAQPAELKYNRRLSADVGSFAFTGSAASLRYARAVIAEAAVFALTGTDATFRRTGGPEPILSTVERAAVFRAAVDRAATFRRSKQVNVRFN